MLPSVLHVERVHVRAERRETRGGIRRRRRADRIADGIAETELGGIRERPATHRVLPEKIDGLVEQILGAEGDVMLANGQRQVLCKLESALVEHVTLR